MTHDSSRDGAGQHPHDGHERHDERSAPGTAFVWPEVFRGLALLLLALAAAVGLIAGARRSGWLLVALTPPLGIVGALATWAAAIHLTGGEKFDDNPCV